MRYKLEEYNVQRDHCRKKDHDADKASTASIPKKESNDRKLVLSKEMRVALLTVSAFTEEQADAIVKETQANLLENFIGPKTR